MKGRSFGEKNMAESQRLTEQISIVNDSPLLDSVLGSLLGILVVLNEDLQIVGLNHAFLQTLGIYDAENSLGLKLGSSVGCVNSKLTPQGCGTSNACKTCGAVIAMMATLHENVTDEQICVLTARKGKCTKNLALLVRTAPLLLDGRRFVVLTARDITKEQTRSNLERVFYHDINNMITVLLGSCDLLVSEMPTRWEVRQAHDAAKRVQREIALQRELSLAESAGEYTPERSQVELSAINTDIELLMRGHSATKGRTIEFQQECEDCLVYTDKHLVSRVLANMLINGLEATHLGGTVKFTVSCTPDAIVWEVWNNTSIPDDIQPRIFQKNFSTKSDEGRGLGTFSMKLFGETYLQGRVDFTSDREDGTVFSFTVPLQLSDY